MGTRLLVIFSLASPKKQAEERSIGRKPREAAAQPLLRVTSTDQLETHTHLHAHTNTHTHTLDALSSQTHVLHCTYLSKSRSKTGLLLPHLLCSHSSFTKWERFVEVICTRVCACACLCVCLSPCFLIPFSPLRETCKNTNTCHVTSHRKESLGKKKKCFY